MPSRQSDSAVLNEKAMLATMIRGITSFVLALSLIAATPTLAQELNLPEGPSPVVVVELFTSQSCPSCPDADEFVGGLQTRSDVIVLSWPVDIWDYLGWEDTLASSENTRRQAQYNGRFGLRWPYTPEIVIDGRTHIAGNQGDAVLTRIEEIRDDSWVQVSMRMRIDDDRLTINVGSAPDEIDDKLGTIWLIPYRSHANVEIGGGPNEGRVLSYTNVAEGNQPISQWSGNSVIVRHPLDLEPGNTPDGYVVLLQKHRNGPILGAARLQLTWNGASTE